MNDRALGSPGKTPQYFRLTRRVWRTGALCAALLLAAPPVATGADVPNEPLRLVERPLARDVAMPQVGTSGPTPSVEPALARAVQELGAPDTTEMILAAIALMLWIAVRRLRR